MKVPPARVPNSVAVTAQRRVLIVDDHPIVRQGLRRMIEPEPDLVVCGEVQTEREARAAIRALAPDVVIVDISLAQGDGLELVRDVHAQRPELPMLVLSMHDELIYAERLLAAGASGYIMKQAASDQLLIALRKVLVGETYLSESLATKLDELYAKFRPPGSRCRVGQVLWAAVAVDDPPGRNKRIEDTRLVPVALDLVTAQDIHEAASLGSRRQTRRDKIVRLCTEAYSQGGVLSLADVALMLHVSLSTVSRDILTYERDTDKIVPRRGTIHDIQNAGDRFPGTTSGSIRKLWHSSYTLNFNTPLALKLHRFGPETAWQPKHGLTWSKNDWHSTKSSTLARHGLINGSDTLPRRALRKESVETTDGHR